MEEDNDLSMDMFIDVEGDINPFIEDEDIDNDNPPVDGDNNNQDEDQDIDPEKVVEDQDLQDEIDDNDEESEDDNTSSSKSNLFKSLAALLKEKALISSEDFEVEDEDSFVELFKKEIEKSEYSDLDDNQKNYLKQTREGIPHEKVTKDLRQLDQLNTVTNDALESDPELRKRVIYQDFVNRGYSDEKATKLVQRSLELDVDFEDAEEAIASIREFTQQRMEKENFEIQEGLKNQEKIKEDNINKIQKEIDSIKEIIPGYEVSENIKNKIKKNMFDVVGDNPTNNQPENSLMKFQRENPVDFDKKLYYLFTITNGFKSFDSIKQDTQSKAIQDLEAAFNSTTKINDPGSPAYLQDPDSYFIDLKGDEIVVD